MARLPTPDNRLIILLNRFNLPPSRREPTYDFAKFPPKLQEIERIWTAGGESSPSRPPVSRHCQDTNRFALHQAKRWFKVRQRSATSCN